MKIKIITTEQIRRDKIEGIIQASDRIIFFNCSAILIIAVRSENEKESEREIF